MDKIKTYSKQTSQESTQALSEKNKQHLKLSSELLLAETIFTQSSHAIVITDSEQIILKVNPAFTRITGYDETEVIGKTPKLLASGKHSREFYAKLWQTLLTKGEWSGEIWNKRKDGHIYPEWETIIAVKEDKQLTHYLAIFSDLSHHKIQEARIEYLAYQDHLTHLPNQSLLKRQVKQSLAKLQRLNQSAALLYLDINDFKKFNDTLGHSVGDQILIQFAKRLDKIVRTGVMVSRFGSDEFIIWLDDIDYSRHSVIDSATRLALQIKDEFSQPLVIDHYDVLVSCSIGIAIFPGDGRNCEQLICKADMAKNQAKSTGGDDFNFFQPEMECSAKKKLQIEFELRRALAKDELTLFYQPQVDVISGKIVGAEALLRWQNAKLGCVSPAEFIPIAEASGLILEIGQWVIEQVCQKIKHWERAGLFNAIKTISVNISPVQFEETYFLETLSKIIQSSTIEPTHLDIELTETALISNFSGVCQRLEAIKSIGCHISIDDFGTGYSSLKYLSAFPLDVLKIDKYFIDKIVEKPSSLAIVRTIVSMAKMLGVHTVAEGVENKTQLEVLTASGCEYYQGYLFNPAMPASRFEALLTACD